MKVCTLVPTVSMVVVCSVPAFAKSKTHQHPDAIVVRHASKDASAKPTEFIIVGVK